MVWSGRRYPANGGPQYLAYQMKEQASIHRMAESFCSTRSVQQVEDILPLLWDNTTWGYAGLLKCNRSSINLSGIVDERRKDYMDSYTKRSQARKTSKRLGKEMENWKLNAISKSRLSRPSPIAEPWAVVHLGNQSWSRKPVSRL